MTGTPMEHQGTVVWRRSRGQLLIALVYFHVCMATMYWMLEPYFGDNYATALGIDGRYLATLPLVLFTCAALPNFRKPSDFTLALMALTVILPTLAFYVMHGGSYAYVLSCWGGFAIYDLLRRYPLILQIKIEMRMSHVILMSFAFVGVVTVLMLQNFEVNSFTALLLDLYQVRAEIFEGAESTLLNYVQGWTHAIVIPFLILYFTIQRMWYMVAILAGLTVLFFLVLTGKGILFDPIFAVAIYFALRNRRAFTILFAAILAIIVIAFLEIWLLDTINVAAVLVRRTLFVPTMLNANYHEIFSEIGHVYYSHSVLSFLSDYPFQIPYQSIVGVSIFGTTTAHANTGIFGTGFMHFGYAGILGFCAIMGLTAAYIDNRPIGRSYPAMTAGMIAVPVYTIFTSADLFSGMLTNGYLLALFYCTVCPQLTATRLTGSRHKADLTV